VPIPIQPKIYHIVHIDKLASIVTDSCLWSDSIMLQRQNGTDIGNSEIKTDRLSLPVYCHPETCVGDYVPFYFCPRSVMLYVISMRNHPNVAYRDGQEMVIHLEASMNEVVEWAASVNRKWAFTDINAANRVADFYNDLTQLDQLNWEAIAAKQWVSCRDYKMAEFLIHEKFPWKLIRRVGVLTEKIQARVMTAFGAAQHRPPVKIKPDWYY
jgi:hypothetical protein